MMHEPAAIDRRSVAGTWPRLALALAATAALAACDSAPLGVSPAYRGTYLEDAVVTNPHGGGPMVERWGPPENMIRGRD